MMEALALKKAKTRIGGTTNLARALGGITPQAISQWRRVPAERVLAVERATGISRSDLRPDLYPREWQEGAAER
jgi:DNA-binding transcriptional regulator YdaS (Cro superfamily)